MRRNYESYLKHWSELETNVAADPQLTFLEPKRAELETSEKRLREALDRQAAGKMQFHDATREIEEIVEAGNAAMVQLHDMIRGHYGRQAEKLILFRLQPRRAKSISAKVRKTRKEGKEKPPENGQSPTQAAHSQTESTN